MEGNTTTVLNKKNNIKFKITNKENNKTFTVNAEIKENKIYRMNKEIFCNTCRQPLIYENEKIICPECNREYEIIEENTENENIYLTYFATDEITLQRLYKLNKVIEYDKWLTISDLFMKLTPNMVQFKEKDMESEYIGWVTSNPDEVEERLNLTSDTRIETPTTKQKQKNNEKLNELKIFDITDKLHEVFSVVETPYGEFNLFEKEKEKQIVKNPLFPTNKNIGTGECWIIKPDEIWYVRYNYRDGDDLRMNNVLIDSKLKAIGKKISYDEDVAKLIKQLKGVS